MRAILGASGAVLAMALASSLAGAVPLAAAEPVPKPYDEQPREQKGRLFHDSARHGTYRK